MLSVILPTIRPERVVGTLFNLKSQALTVPLDVVVVADWFDRPRDVTWIQAPRQGVIAAVQTAYTVCRGDVIFLTNDETTIRSGSLQALYAAVMTQPDTLFTPRHEPAFPFFYYGKFFAAFPCGHRSLFERLGGFLDPVYRGFYADPDLSLRAHAAGVPVEVVDGAVIDHWNNSSRPDHRANVAAYLEMDRATFRARWDHLGEFCDP